MCTDHVVVDRPSVGRTAREAMPSQVRPLSPRQTGRWRRLAAHPPAPGAVRTRSGARTRSALLGETPTVTSDNMYSSHPPACRCLWGATPAEGSRCGKPPRHNRPRVMPVGGFAFAFGGLLCIVLGLFGGLEPFALCALTVLALSAMVTSIRRYRPSSAWPWYAICTALALFVVGGSAAGALGTLGNLTAHRSIIPDIITIPGYLILAAGLLGFTRARSSGVGSSLGVVLDAVMVSLAILACAWVYIIEPVLLRRQTPLDIRLALTCYPAASVFLVVVTLRIAFGPDQRRSPSYWFLLFAMCMLFIGDLLYMLTEIHLLHLPNGVLDLPYEVGYLAAGLGALHPSMRSLTEHVGRTEHAEAEWANRHRDRCPVRSGAPVAQSVPGTIRRPDHGVRYHSGADLHGGGPHGPGTARI